MRLFGTPATKTEACGRKGKSFRESRPSFRPSAMEGALLATEPVYIPLNKTNLSRSVRRLSLSPRPAESKAAPRPERKGRARKLETLRTSWGNLPRPKPWLPYLFSDPNAYPLRWEAFSIIVPQDNRKPKQKGAQPFFQRPRARLNHAYACSLEPLQTRPYHPISSSCQITRL